VKPRSAVTPTGRAPPPRKSLQRAQAHRLVLDRIAHRRVLFGLDHQPALIAVLGRHLAARVEIHGRLRHRPAR
jgi:hypothetical protein